jgi:hypothetical protein
MRKVAKFVQFNCTWSISITNSWPEVDVKSRVYRSFRHGKQRQDFFVLINEDEMEYPGSTTRASGTLFALKLGVTAVGQWP